MICIIYINKGIIKCREILWSKINKIPRNINIRDDIFVDKYIYEVWFPKNKNYPKPIEFFNKKKIIKRDYEHRLKFKYNTYRFSGMTIEQILEHNKAIWKSENDPCNKNHIIFGPIQLYTSDLFN